MTSSLKGIFFKKCVKIRFDLKSALRSLNQTLFDRHSDTLLFQVSHALVLQRFCCCPGWRCGRGGGKSATNTRKSESKQCLAEKDVSQPDRLSGNYGPPRQAFHPPHYHGDRDKWRERKRERELTRLSIRTSCKRRNTVFLENFPTVCASALLQINLLRYLQV